MLDLGCRPSAGDLPSQPSWGWEWEAAGQHVPVGSDASLAPATGGVQVLEELVAGQPDQIHTNERWTKEATPVGLPHLIPPGPRCSLMRLVAFPPQRDSVWEAPGPAMYVDSTK